MPFLDSEKGELVIRIAFDGPPLSGKTTTVRALAASLGATVESPGETLRRTIFFDWLEYTGGLWNGHKIRCQVVTVPGQSSLGGRRFQLLRKADCVVFVFDTSSLQVRNSFSALEELECVLNTLPEPHPRILLQLNKRDLANAAPRSEITDKLPARYSNIAETVAEDSRGIRDVFIRAVGLALTHAEDLRLRGELPAHGPNVESSSDLMAFLHSTESSGPSIQDRSNLDEPLSLAASAWSFLDHLGEKATEPEPAAAPAEEDETDDYGSKSHLAPSGEVPAGAVWPPTRGRALIHQLEAVSTKPVQRGPGGWYAHYRNAWIGFSAADHWFKDFQEGRKTLLSLTRETIASEALLSEDRCLVLSPAGPAAWRLWEVTIRIPSLEKLMTTPSKAAPALVVAALAKVFSLYRKLSALASTPGLRVPISPRSCGLQGRRLVYTEFLSMPYVGAKKEGEAVTEQTFLRLAEDFLEIQEVPPEAAAKELRALAAGGGELAEASGDLAQLLASGAAYQT